MNMRAVEIFIANSPIFPKIANWHRPTRPCPAYEGGIVTRFQGYGTGQPLKTLNSF
jgi:hypothetical protein